MTDHGSPPRPRRSTPPIDSIATPKARGYHRAESHRTEYTFETQTTNNTSSSKNNRRRRVEAPPTERQKNIQVCIRVRPLLPSDNKPAATHHLTGSNRRLFPPVPGENGRMKYTKLTVGIKEKNRSTTITERQRNSVIAAAASSGQDTSEDAPMQVESAWDVTGGSTVSQAPHTKPEPTRQNSYTFDHVFGPDRSTADVYRETVKENVTATMEGYHASVFAYGQTATGKTFTMSGNKKGGANTNSSSSVGSDEEDPNSKGIIQLAVQECFDYIHAQKDDPREFLLRVSFMEIYNEVIYDLLATNTRTQPYMTTSTKSLMSQSTIQPPSVIRIFESKNEGVVIRGLKEEIVTSQEQVLHLLAVGEKRRQTGSTASNKQSSRSHSIFRLIVESRRRTPRPPNLSKMGVSDASSIHSDSIASSTFAPVSAAGPVRVSTLSLVDLAGSESVRNTGSTGTRQREGQYINKSLLTLGHVIYKLAELKRDRFSHEDTTHIPYRDSKLTRLLQSSLSGNAQICIICNISPVIKHLDESHLTLKFATRAKRIKQNAIVTEVVDEKTLLENYRSEIEMLKRDLKEARENQRSSQHADGADSIASPQSLSFDNQGEDSHVLAQAISNLERLILKTTTAEERKAKKERRERRSKTPSTINAFLNKGAAKNGFSPNDGDNDAGDDLLGDASLTLDSAGNMIPKNSQGEDDNSITDVSLGDESTIVEGRKLITELHRIQGLLNTVQKHKGTPRSRQASPIVPQSPVPATPMSFSSPAEKDDEVERLRAQLHEQAVTTSLRKADSTFLQKELQEKNDLLTETSKFLETVEERQLALEAENMKLKMELAKHLDAIKVKTEKEIQNAKLLAEKDEEIRRLKGGAIKSSDLEEKQEELRRLRGSLN